MFSDNIPAMPVHHGAVLSWRSICFGRAKTSFWMCLIIFCLSVNGVTTYWLAILFADGVLVLRYIIISELIFSGLLLWVCFWIRRFAGLLPAAKAIWASNALHAPLLLLAERIQVWFRVSFSLFLCLVLIFTLLQTLFIGKLKFGSKRLDNRIKLMCNLTT